MTTAYCPNCSARAEPSARYCRACYAVFPTEAHSVGGHAHRRGSGGGGGTWKFALLLFAALGGAWFYSIDTEDWSAEPGSFEAAAINTKRQIVGYAAGARESARRALGVSEAQAPRGRTVAAADVRRSAAGCSVAQTVVNRHTAPVSPLILTFSFRAQDGSAVGEPVERIIDQVLRPGASRRLSVELPCPELFASVQVRSPDQRIALADPHRAANSPAGGTPAWLLDLDPRLACARGAACELVIRFRSGAVASYAAERVEQGGVRLVAADPRGTALMSRSSRAALLVTEPGRETRSIPIVREADDRWTVDEEAAASSATRGAP